MSDHFGTLCIKGLIKIVETVHIIFNNIAYSYFYFFKKMLIPEFICILDFPSGTPHLYRDHSLFSNVFREGTERGQC